MSTRTCVFIDGENFRHSIVDLFTGEFDRKDYLPQQADWAELFDYLVSKATDNTGERVRSYWYVVNHLDCFPFNLRKLKAEQGILERILQNYEEFRSDLDGLADGERQRYIDNKLSELEEEAVRIRQRFDWWTGCQERISQECRAIEFRRAGAIKYDLLRRQFGSEKAVDVKLATDMIVLCDIYDVAVIVSGDQDYVPAVQVIKDRGKRVIDVAFETRSGKSLPGGARRLGHLTDWSVSLKHEDLAGYLGIGS